MTNQDNDIVEYVHPLLEEIKIDYFSNEIKAAPFKSTSILENQSQASVVICSWFLLKSTPYKYIDLTDRRT